MKKREDRRRERERERKSLKKRRRRRRNEESWQEIGSTKDREEASRVEKFRETRNLVGKREILAGPWKQDLKWDDVEQSKHRFQVYDTPYESSVDGFLLKLLQFLFFFSFSFPLQIFLRKNIFRRDDLNINSRKFRFVSNLILLSFFFLVNY